MFDFPMRELRCNHGMNLSAEALDDIHETSLSESDNAMSAEMDRILDTWPGCVCLTCKRIYKMPPDAVVAVMICPCCGNRAMNEELMR